MNPESLDTSIQGALSALYPPFEATAPTVLSQLFRVIEERYSGDALQCLLDFLIPAKHILESVQQAACAAYSDVLFRCEGWPLCMREKVVIQLASINPLLLRPGDFYLQAVPFANQSARIVLKSLLEEHQQVEETPIPETYYPCIFTEDWLREVNEDRHGTPLCRCLLSTDQGVVKVPWGDVAKPEFVEKPKVMANPLISSEGFPNTSAFSVKTRILPAKDGISVSLHLVDSCSPRLIKVEQTKPAGRPVGWVSPNTWDRHGDREIEGDYVDLVEFTKEKEALAIAKSPPHSKAPFRPLRPAPPPPCRDSVPCAGTLRFSEEPCTPCLRRKLSEGCELKEHKCRYRESYLEAQQNPVTFEKSKGLPTLNESKTPGNVDGSPKPAVEDADSRDSEVAPGGDLQCCQTKLDCQVAACKGNETSITRYQQSSLKSRESTGKALSYSFSETSRKSPMVQRQANRSHSDIFPDMIPNIHVLQYKKATAFGLVSPKTDRRRCVKQDDSQTFKAETSSSLAPTNGYQKKRCSPPSETPPGLLPGASTLNTKLLQLGIARLPGSRDKSGRAVLEIYTDHKDWKSPLVSSQELCRLLLYFYSIPRKEVRELGMSIITDARKMAPPPALYKALLMFQEQAPQSLNSIYVLVDKETNQRPEKHPGLQTEVVTSMKALHKIVEGHQLTLALEGTFPYHHVDWLQLYQKMKPFTSDLKEASSLLQNAIRKIEGTKKTDTVQDVQKSIDEQKTMMKDVLEDTQLVALQREGGATLARLRREEVKFTHSEDYKDAMDTVTSLYNQVEEHVHMLVMRSNQSLQHLEFLLMLRELEGRYTKIREWFTAEGEQRLLQAESVEESLERVQHTLKSFKTFLTEATEQKQQAKALVFEVEVIQAPSYPEMQVFRTMVHTQMVSITNFLARAEQCHTELETMVRLCDFCERATHLAKECRQYLEQSQPGCCASKDNLALLKKYQEKFSEFSLEPFEEVKAQAHTLKGSRGMRVWNVAWLRCQEVQQMLEERLKIHHPQPIDEISTGDKEASAVATSAVKPVSPSTAPCSTERSLSNNEGNFKTCVKTADNSCKAIVTGLNPEGEDGIKETLLGSMDPQACHWQNGLGRSLSDSCCTSALHTIAQSPFSVPCSHSQPTQRMLQAAQRFQISRHGSFCSESLDVGNLHISFSPNVLRREGVGSTGGEQNSSALLQRIMEELLLTERDYVRSLGYVMEHYFPLLERPDVPQDLRGQRGHIFGNLEKLHDFHRHFFLRELEGCSAEPFRVGRCFLKYKESFDLYALYSKNKPQSDSILINHGHDFFQQKQMELMDKMDLMSYLLKPVQRISKYNLLLQDILKECEVQKAGEMTEIQAALQVVQFQLRHGNDLLAMDDIQDCDVNMKEQGQLIRQDEFLVSYRKKKCFRHVFLFQDLILFSKTKKTDVGNDVYIYKQSFKTSDVGMTHNSGDSGLCFEIWFRRRKTQDTYVLQASRTVVKEAWTRDLEHILWEQAMRSREIRLQERLLMGVGGKPFMDIQPSEAAICDRAVRCGPGQKDPGSLLSCASSESTGALVSSRPNSIGSGSSNSSSSSSGRGSLPPIGYLCSHAHVRHSDRLCAAAGALEEDNLESEHTPLLIDSSESSGESVSGFSSSDRSCLSVIGGESEDMSVSSSIYCKPGSTTRTSLQERTSPPCQRKGPSAAPKALPVTEAQKSGKSGETAAVGRSTEV